MKKTKILPIIIGVVVFIALVVGGVLLWKGSSAKPNQGNDTPVTVSEGEKDTGSSTDEKSKTITFKVVQKDKSEQEFVIKTEQEFLANALADENLITYDEEGFYTTINGVTADYSADQSWWCIMKDGVMTEVGMNTQPIADGEHYEAVYTIG